MADPTESPMTETYFKRGARIGPKIRREVTEASIPERRRRGEAYELAMANLHKPWARRYLRSLGGFF